jgi:hypothetical protein
VTHLTPSREVYKKTIDTSESEQVDAAYQRPPMDENTVTSKQVCVYQGNSEAPTWCAKRAWYMDLSKCAECEYRKERK